MFNIIILQKIQSSQILNSEYIFRLKKTFSKWKKYFWVLTPNGTYYVPFGVQIQFFVNTFSEWKMLVDTKQNILCSVWCPNSKIFFPLGRCIHYLFSVLPTKDVQNIILNVFLLRVLNSKYLIQNTVSFLERALTCRKSWHSKFAGRLLRRSLPKAFLEIDNTRSHTFEVESIIRRPM